MNQIYKMMYVLAAMICLVIASANLEAQSAVSQVSGVIKDATGAIVPDAEIQIKNTDTNIVHTVRSDGAGAYTIPSLPIGNYQLQVKKQGFSTYVQDGITLAVNSNPQINVGLQVGLVTQEVEVQANAAMVESQSTAVSQVINPQQVIDLPLNGRQPTDLIALSGAAVTAVSTNTSSSIASTSAIGTLDYPSAVAYSIAGSQINSTNYYLDGGQHLDYRTNIGLPLPFPDALSEFSLATSAMPANLGVHPGGSISAVTRSGGNRFHGNVFEFVRNGILDATSRTYALAEGGAAATGVRDTLQRNQFGGTFGGPIKKDKIFFFGGYQGTIQTSTTGVSTVTIPTTAMITTGNLSALLPGNSNGCTAQTVASAYVTSPGSNMIQPALLNTSSALLMQKYYANYIPSSGFYDACGDYHYQASPSYYYEGQYVGRTDWQRTAKDSIFASYFLSNYNNPSYMVAGNIPSASGVGLADRIQTFSLGDNYVLNSNTINTARFTFNRSATQRISNPNMPTLCSLGANVTCPVANNIDLLFGVKPGFEGYDYENSFGITDGLSVIKGKHQISVGFTWIHVQMNGDGTFQENPEATFSSATTGSAFGDEVTGNLDAILQGQGQLSRDGQNQPSLYAQDTWKVQSRLQMTAGIRWDPFFAQHNKYDEVGDFTLAGYQAGAMSQVYTNAPPGMTFTGDQGFHGKSDTNNQTKTFAPRLGFVWDMNGKGTETLRAGYGYFYDTSVLWNTMHVVLNPPWGETLSFTPLSVANGGGLANPYAGNNGPNPFPFFNPPNNFVYPNNGTFIFENQNNKPTNVQQWNLSYQRQLSSNLLLSATYMGNKTSHVWLGISQNYDQPYQPSVYGVGPNSLPCTLPWGTSTYTFAHCNEPSGTTEYDSTTGNTVTNVNARRALNLIHPQYGPQLQGGVTTAFAYGDGAYNGLLVSVEKRMSHGLQALGNYTWSHCLDDGEIGQDIGNTPMNPLSPKSSSWGNCTWSKKGIANLSLVAQTPHFENAVVRAVASGWSGSGIFTASTGYYYSVTDNFDISLTGVGSDRPNIVGNPNQGGTVGANPNCTAPAQVHTIAHWYNPCAFAWNPTLQAGAAPALGTFGDLVRNSLVGPANWNLNLAVWRSFNLPERIKLDFRVEAFNALNHTQISNPSLTLASSGANSVLTSSTNEGINANAGLISTSSPTYTPRILQLAIKASF